MFCKFCGKQIDNDSLFCKHCGKELEKDSKKIYNITIYDNFQRRHDKFEINNGITFYELKAFLQNKGFIPFNIRIGSFNVYEIQEDNKVSVIFDESKESNKKIDCTIFEKYENPSLLIDYRQDIGYRDPGSFVCLYGCPVSNKIKNNEKGE